MRINGLMGGIVALLLSSSAASADGVCTLEMISGHPSEHCDAEVTAEQRAAIFSAVQSCTRQGMGVQTGGPVYSASDVNCVPKTTAILDPGSGSGGSSTGGAASASGGTFTGSTGSSNGTGGSGSTGKGKPGKAAATTAAATGGAYAHHRGARAATHPAAARSPAAASRQPHPATAATSPHRTAPVVAVRPARPARQMPQHKAAAPAATPAKASAPTPRMRPHHPLFGQHRMPPTGGRPIKKPLAQ